MDVTLKVVVVAVRQLLMLLPDNQQGTPYQIFWLNLPDQETFKKDGRFLRSLSTNIDRRIWQMMKTSRFSELHSLGVVEYGVPIEGGNRARAEHILLYAIELEPEVESKQTPLPKDSYYMAFNTMLPLHAESVGIPDADAVLQGVDKWLRVSSTFECLATELDLAAPIGSSKK